MQTYRQELRDITNGLTTVEQIEFSQQSLHNEIYIDPVYVQHEQVASVQQAQYQVINLKFIMIASMQVMESLKKLIEILKI